MLKYIFGFQKMQLKCIFREVRALIGAVKVKRSGANSSKK
jgi:hypothetical protein